MLENHVKPLVIEFLQARGLTLSEEKTKITHIEEGFDFLGFNIRKYKGKFITKPSKKSRKRFLDKVREIVDKNKSSKQQSLIRLLNPVIRGWANYYKGVLHRKLSVKQMHKFSTNYGDGLAEDIPKKVNDGLPTSIITL